MNLSTYMLSAYWIKTIKLFYLNKKVQTVSIIYAVYHPREKEPNLIVQDATLTQGRFNFLYVTRIWPRSLNLSNILARNSTYCWGIIILGCKRFRRIRNHCIFFSYNKLTWAKALHYLLQSLPPMLKPTPHASSLLSKTCPPQHCHTSSQLNQNHHQK